MSKHIKKEVATYLLKGTELSITYNQFEDLIKYEWETGEIPNHKIIKLKNWWNEEGNDNLTLQEFKEEHNL